MFTPEQKNIFSYNNGQQVVFADPLACRRRFIRATEGQHNILLKRYYEGAADEMSLIDAEEALVKATRTTFSLGEYNESTGQGLRDAQCLDILNEFLEWLKKNVRMPENSPTSVDAITSTQT